MFFPLFFQIFINIHEYANKIICILDHGIQGLCLSFNLVPSLVVYNQKQLRYDWFNKYIPILENRITGCHWNHAFSNTPNTAII